MNAKKIIFAPLYALSIFSGAKSFRDNPVIGSHILNRLGLHVFRIILSRLIWKFRQFLLSPLATQEDRQSYNQNGFVLKENFLRYDLFLSVVEEVKKYQGEAWQCVQGGTTTWRVFLDSKTLSTLPALNQLSKDQAFLSLTKYGAAKNERPLLYIQQVRNNIDGDKEDPQKNLHSDTFHPTMKAWLFLEDVPEDKGPFTYVPGSSRLTARRLKWEYNMSVKGKNDSYSARGSFRVNEADLSTLGLPQPKSFAVRQNTLVMANTNGFHARGYVHGYNVTRLEIWAFSRPNPFNPWIGLGIKPFATLRDKIFRRYLENRDLKARSKNRRASWHKVEGRII